MVARLKPVPERRGSARRAEMQTLQIGETLYFADEEHRRYYDLLLSYGFSFEVSAMMQVGRRFIHPTKGHLVELEINEDEPDSEIYEPKLRILRRSTDHNGMPKAMPSLDDYDTPLFEDYSLMEQGCLREVSGDSFAMLQRELYIWMKVRPHSLNSLPKKWAA